MSELHLDPARFEQAREAAVAAFLPKDWKLSDPQRVLLNLQMHAALSAALDVVLAPVVELAMGWAAHPEGSTLDCADDLLRLLTGERDHAQ